VHSWGKRYGLQTCPRIHHWMPRMSQTGKQKRPIVFLFQHSHQSSSIWTWDTASSFCLEQLTSYSLTRQSNISSPVVDRSRRENSWETTEWWPTFQGTLDLLEHFRLLFSETFWICTAMNWEFLEQCTLQLILDPVKDLDRMPRHNIEYEPCSNRKRKDWCQDQSIEIHEILHHHPFCVWSILCSL